MPLTLLFDLDDTLLETNVDSFVPAYFQALTQYLEPRVLPTVALRALILGMSAMNDSDDPTRTLQDVFDSDFYPRIGLPKEELVEALDTFYDEVFPTLGSLTRQKPEAGSLIRWALDCNFRIAIATDPLFPRKATYHRLRWAGFDPEQFEVVSTNENFHFTKTHPAYYAEVLGNMGWSDGPILMVGNDLHRDILPAQKLGLKTYLVETESGSNPENEAGGRLDGLRPWLESRDLSTLETSFKSRDAILGIMSSTPAVLQTLTKSLTNEQWTHEPTREDWAINEIICHLRDTEREIHTSQLDLMTERMDAFIPRPDTSVWANERDYLHVDGALALREFAAARMKNLKRLRGVSDEMWARRARHAIFGPTDFLEVIGFMAEHDRMHIQQAWKTMNNF